MIRGVAALLLVGLVTLPALGAEWGRNRLVAEEVLLRPAGGKVVVDGDLGDWERKEATLLRLRDPEAAGGAGALDDYRAEVAFRYDREALYLAVWWQDPTPQGPETDAAAIPPGDGLVLTIPGEAARRVALWRMPLGTTGVAILRSAVAPLGQSLAEGRPVGGLTQGYKVTGKSTYTQEARLPWSELGRKAPTVEEKLRWGVDLCFGGLDATKGYREYAQLPDPDPESGNRWGGGVGWGFADGYGEPEAEFSTDPRQGALVTLAPTYTPAPPNPPTWTNGSEVTRTTAMVATSAVRLTVDGYLAAGEWDPESGTWMAYEPSLFPDRYGARVMWQYSPEGLYLGLRWHTGGPQYNAHDPAHPLRGAGGGDALRLHLDTGRSMHLEAWRWSEAKEAGRALVLLYCPDLEEGTWSDALAEGARLAFVDLAGGGYSQEIFLPWKLITPAGTPLKEGDTFRAALELYFSGVEGNRMAYILAPRVAEEN